MFETYKSREEAKLKESGKGTLAPLTGKIAVVLSTDLRMMRRIDSRSKRSMTLQLLRQML